ncbi:MAG: peptidase M50, partial [Mycobacterium sp.]
MNDVDIAVLVFGEDGVPGPLRGLSAARIEDRDDVEVVEAAIAGVRRVVVIGADADLAAVLTLLLRAGRLDVEVGYAPRRRTA